MYNFAPKINTYSQKVLNPILDFLHLTLKLTPNQISVISFALSILAAGFILSGFVTYSLALIILSLIFDAFDGGVARKFGMTSGKGEMLELIFDRTGEAIIFISLAYVELISYKIAILALFAILLVSTLRDKSKFDPGFKRIMIPFGFFIGYENAVTIVFFVNLLGFVASMAILDYIYDTKGNKK